MGIGSSKNAVKPETSHFFMEASKTPASGKQGLYQIQLIGIMTVGEFANIYNRNEPSIKPTQTQFWDKSLTLSRARLMARALSIGATIEPYSIQRVYAILSAFSCSGSIV